MFNGIGWSREDYAKCPECGRSYYDVEQASVITEEENADGITAGMIVMCKDCFAKSSAETIMGYCAATVAYWATLNDWSPLWPEMQDTVAKSIATPIISPPAKIHRLAGGANENKV